MSTTVLDQTPPTITGTFRTGRPTRPGGTTATRRSASRGMIRSRDRQRHWPTSARRVRPEGRLGAAQGTATDKAGLNSASATVSGINIDRAAPTSDGRPRTGRPTPTGWYNSNVTVSFTGDVGSRAVASVTDPVCGQHRGPIRASRARRPTRRGWASNKSAAQHRHDALDALQRPSVTGRPTCPANSLRDGKPHGELMRLCVAASPA